VGQMRLGFAMTYARTEGTLGSTILEYDPTFTHLFIGRGSDL